MKKIMFCTIAILSAVLSAQADNAKINWKMHCAMCHGKNGQANTPAGRHLGAPNLQEAKAQASFTDEEAFNAIKKGIVKEGRMKMKSYASELTDQDIRDLVKYLRTFKQSK